MIDQINLEKFNLIYDSTYNDVLKFIIVRCFNMNDVNDILQDVYVEVYKKITKGVDVDLPYVIGIAKNKIKKYYTWSRKIKSISLFQKEFDDKELLDNIPSDVNIEAFILRQDDFDKAWHFLEKKKGIVQKIFYLYYHEDLTIKKIANLLAVGESFVKNVIYRTLKELKEVLKEG